MSASGIDEQALSAFDLRQLHQFLVLAEQRTISGAAAKLGIAQPSLSEALVRLEKRLGAQLVVRGGRGIQLTEAGVVLRAYAQQLFDIAGTAVREVRRLGKEPAGPVSLGLVSSLALLLSAPLADTILHEHPTIRLRIAEVMSADMLDLLAAGNHDLGCLYDVSPSPQILAEPLFVEEMLLVTAPDNWTGEFGADGRAGEPIKAAALAGLPLVLPSARNGLRKMIDRVAHAQGFTLNVVMEIDSLSQIIAMVDRASAYTVLSRAAVASHVAANRLALVPIIDPSIQRTAFLVRSTGHPVSQATLKVEVALRTIIADFMRRYRHDLQDVDQVRT